MVYKFQIQVDRWLGSNPAQGMYGRLGPRFESHSGLPNLLPNVTATPSRFAAGQINQVRPQSRGSKGKDTRNREDDHHLNTKPFSIRTIILLSENQTTVKVVVKK